MRLILLIAPLIIIVVGAITLWHYFSSYESTDDAQVDGHINSISARISGHVAKLNIQDNQYVEAGAVLVEIDPTDYQVALDRVKANYQDAEASASAARVNVPITSVSTTSQVATAQASVENARAGIKAAKQQLQAAKAQLQQAEPIMPRRRMISCVTSNWSKSRRFLSSSTIKHWRPLASVPPPSRLGARRRMPPNSKLRRRKPSWCRRRPTCGPPTLRHNRCRQRTPRPNPQRL